MRGFEIVSEFKHKYVVIPKRATTGSAGYDFYTANEKEVVLHPGETVVLPTGMKASMEKDEVLLLYIRSSMGIKKHLMLSNCVGVIDSDYYNNPDNEGHILLAITNIGKTIQRIAPWERIAQGIFVKYLKTDNDETNEVRVGGIGSTNNE